MKYVHRGGLSFAELEVVPPFKARDVGFDRFTDFLWAGR